MVGAAMKAEKAARTAFESDVADKWQPFRANGGTKLEVQITTAVGWA
jgi:hypothetical protein